jgi:hypothetical protein
MLIEQEHLQILFNRTTYSTDSVDNRLSNTSLRSWGLYDKLIVL